MHFEFDTLSLDDQIDMAEWELTLAQTRLDDLRKQKAELDAHIETQYQAHLDAEFGRATLESDNHDCRIREALNA